MAVSHDDNQPCSLNRGVEEEKEDDGCTFLVELPEDDFLFEEKRKVILEKGFAVSERVCLTRLLCSYGVDTILDELLRRARILKLNELELYFGEMTVDPPPEFFSTTLDPPSQFYSLRNELEALSFILSKIDILLKNFKQEKTVLHDLRDCTVHRISGIGSRNVLKTRIVEDSCTKERSLMQWAQSNGIRSKLEIFHVQGAGRGAIAVEDLNVGDVALEIPVSVIISEDTFHNSAMSSILKQVEGVSSETMLLLWSMREKHNQSSPYKYYFESLPDNFNTGLRFGWEALMALSGTLVMEEIIQCKEHLRSQYDELFPVLCDAFPEVFPPELYTWEHYLWACELWYSNSMKIMFADGVIRTCLVPVAGFLNHSICPHILHYGKVDPETNSLKFPLSTSCKVGEECYLSYGNLSNSHLLTFYGFLPRGENPFDFIPVSLDESKMHMVRAPWLSKNHEIFHYGLPTPLLNHLRKSYNPHMRALGFTQLDLENEMWVLGALYSTFKDMLDGLEGSDNGSGLEASDTESGLEDTDDDRDTVSWDVKLAVEFKNQQRRIVSSVLSSLDAGLEEVQIALCNSMEEDTRG